MSDNGGNFVKANSELAKGLTERNQTMIEETLQQKHIQWNFNPPYCSHRGGTWERQIRTLREISMVTLNVQEVTYEVLETVLVQAEEIVNNRPITKISEDPCDPSVLRPSDLLLQFKRDVTPNVPICSADQYKKSWKHVQYLVDLFWSKWIKFYVPELQTRQKWRKESPNFKVGDVVLISDIKTYRNLWPLGIVLEAKKSDDGLVRTLKLRSLDKEIVRVSNKVVHLEGCLE